jgi:hypothetical protein
MADTKTSDEVAATVLTGAELVRVVQSATSKKTTAALVGHQFRGCRLERTTSLTLQNYTAGTTDIVFQVATLDTDSFWSAGTPGRATIPASKGFKVANVAAAVRIDSLTVDTFATMYLQHYNSSNVQQRVVGLTSEAGDTVRWMNATMLAVPVADGDYFVVRPDEESDTSVTVNSSGTGLAVEIIGMEP